MIKEHHPTLEKRRTESSANKAERLFEGDEARRVRGADARSAMSDWCVGDGELTEVASNHVGLDLDKDVALAVVDTDLRADHLGDDDHVAQVGLDDGGLLALAGGLLGL